MKKILKTFASVLAIAAMCTVMFIGYAEEGNLTDHIYSTETQYSLNRTSGSAASRTWTQVSDNQWTCDVDGNGTADVMLTSSTNSDGNQVWQYTFNVEDASQAYKVYEEMTGNGMNPIKSDYTSTGTDNKPATPQDYGTVDTKTKTYTITNHKDHTAPTNSTGSLKITKHVSGVMPNKSQKFTFNITLSGNTDALKNAVTGAKVFGDVPFVDGKGSVSLADGESASITGLPAGITYTVTESDAGKYFTLSSKTGDTGTIQKDTESDAVFTNTSTYVEPQDQPEGSFTIRKTVSGTPDDADADYTFHVALANLQPEHAYVYFKDNKNVSFVSDDNGTADITIALKDKEEAEFSVPVDSTYQVTEDAGNYRESYQITDADSQTQTPAQITKSADSCTKENTQLATAKETMDDEDENVVITYTNTFIALQDLKVRVFMQKDVAGTMERYTDKNIDFTVKVEFSNMPEGTVIKSDIGNIVPDDTGNASRSFKISAIGDDGLITFKDIPVGVTYRMTEEPSEYLPAYDITAKGKNGKEITGTFGKSEGEGEANKGVSTGTDDKQKYLDPETDESIIENQTDTVTFVNSINLNFAVHKVDETEKSISVPGAEYELSHLETDKDDPSGYKLVSKGKQTTDASGFAGWKNDPSGIYVLKETKAPDGYQAHQDVVVVIQDDGTVKYAASKDAKNDAVKIVKDSTIADRMQTWEVEKQTNVQEKDDDGNITGETTYTVYQLEEAVKYNVPTGIKGFGIFGGIILAFACAAAMIYIRKRDISKKELKKLISRK